MTPTPEALDALGTLGVGLALAGLLASAYELATTRRASFGLLERGGLAAVAALPVLAFGAPYLILRGLVRGGGGEGRPVPFVVLATMAACGWGLASGRLALDLAGLIAGA